MVEVATITPEMALTEIAKIERAILGGRNLVQRLKDYVTQSAAQIAYLTRRAGGGPDDGKLSVLMSYGAAYAISEGLKTLIWSAESKLAHVKDPEGLAMIHAYIAQLNEARNAAEATCAEEKSKTRRLLEGL